MPIIKSAKKRVRQAEKRREQNRALKTYMKNLRKKTMSLIEAKEMSPDETAKAVDFFKSCVDKAWSKHLFKRNKASRLKAGMDKMFYSTFVAVNKQGVSDAEK